MIASLLHHEVNLFSQACALLPFYLDQRLPSYGLCDHCALSFIMSSSFSIQLSTMQALFVALFLYITGVQCRPQDFEDDSDLQTYVSVRV
jgi:hypothetical protein